MACYIFKHPDCTEFPDAYKVGKGNNVECRISNLQTGYIKNITERWYLYPTLDKAYTSGMLFFIEKTCHNILSVWRISEREFFRIADIDYFIEYVIDYMRNIGIDIKTTRNSDDLKDLYDYSLRDDPPDDREMIVPTALSPYPYQLEILHNMKTWYESKDVGGKLIMPPGIGKSYITAFWLREFPAHTKVLILVPYISIKSDFEQVIQKCGVSAEVTVDVNNTAWNKSYEPFDIVIYDEAHHICAPKNKNLLELTACKRLFLTATERVYDDNTTFDMTEASFGRDIYRMEIFPAVQKGLLADYKIFLADWTNGLKSMLEQLTNVYHRRRIIMFFNTIKRTKSVCADIKETGFPVDNITAETKEKDRRDIIDKFVNGTMTCGGIYAESADYSATGITAPCDGKTAEIPQEYNVMTCGGKTAEIPHGVSILCNVDCIGEGVNIPCIDTVIFMDTRQSNIGVIQNIGRGLRRTKEKDFCMVVVNEEMLNEKFIANLVVYDQRMSAPRGMVIASKNVCGKKNPNYSVDGFVTLVEKFSSRGLTETEAFVKKLKENGIYSKTMYRKSKFAEECKTPSEKYSGFEWSMLIECKNPYEYNECVTRIQELWLKEKNEMKKIGDLRDRLIYLYAIDKRIDPRFFDTLKDHPNLKSVFAPSITMGILK